MADEQRDVIEVLEHDHREVEEMFDELATLMREIRHHKALPRTAAGPAASLFDRMRDLATGRGTDD